MRLSLFGRSKTSEEIEREVTEQIESLARSGHNPPPPEWTVAGGLSPTGTPPVEIAPAPDPAAEEARAKASSKTAARTAKEKRVTAKTPTAKTASRKRS